MLPKRTFRSSSKMTSKETPKIYKIFQTSKWILCDENCRRIQRQSITQTSFPNPPPHKKTFSTIFLLSQEQFFSHDTFLPQSLRLLIVPMIIMCWWLSSRNSQLTNTSESVCFMFCAMLNSCWSLCDSLNKFHFNERGNGEVSSLVATSLFALLINQKILFILFSPKQKCPVEFIYCRAPVIEISDRKKA